MKLILCDINPEICDAWVEAFELKGKPLSEIIVFQGRFQDLRIDDGPGTYNVMTAAGNSFGVMGGGIDLEIAHYFPGVEVEVRKAIYREWQGELNVGAAVTVEVNLPTAVSNWAYLIYPPTMRAPISIKLTQNVYLAMKATLQQYYKLINASPYQFNLVVPGLGGHCGQVAPKVVAKQMKLAYDNWCNKRVAFNTREMRAAHSEVIGVCE